MLWNHFAKHVDFLSVLRVTLLHGLSVSVRDLEGEPRHPASSERKGPDTPQWGYGFLRKLFFAVEA